MRVIVNPVMSSSTTSRGTARTAMRRFTQRRADRDGRHAGAAHVHGLRRVVRTRVRAHPRADRPRRSRGADRSRRRRQPTVGWRVRNGSRPPRRPDDRRIRSPARARVSSRPLERTDRCTPPGGRAATSPLPDRGDQREPMRRVRSRGHGRDHDHRRAPPPFDSSSAWTVRGHSMPAGLPRPVALRLVRGAHDARASRVPAGRGARDTTRRITLRTVTASRADCTPATSVSGAPRFRRIVAPSSYRPARS